MIIVDLFDIFRLIGKVLSGIVGTVVVVGILWYVYVIDKYEASLAEHWYEWNGSEWLGAEDCRECWGDGPGFRFRWNGLYGERLKLEYPDGAPGDPYNRYTDNEGYNGDLQKFLSWHQPGSKHRVRDDAWK
jgi:hypothetical protein